MATADAGEANAHFPVTTCTTCGQHYYLAHLKDFRLAARKPTGGEAGANGSWWAPLQEAQGSKRVVLVDRLERERQRVLDGLLPKRFALAGEAQVFPVAVEVRLS